MTRLPNSKRSTKAWIYEWQCVAEGAIALFHLSAVLQIIPYLPLHAPEFDGFVTTNRSNRLAVGAERYASNLSAMPLEGVEFLPLNAPEFDGFVITRGKTRVRATRG